VFSNDCKIVLMRLYGLRLGAHAPTCPLLLAMPLVKIDANGSENSLAFLYANVLESKQSSDG